MNEIGAMGEDRLIEAMLSHAPLGKGHAGPGDDCAVIEQSGDWLQLLKTDAIVEGVHWTPGTEAHRVGWKAVARVISDFAAMGGRAKHFLITVVMPPDTRSTWAENLYRGMGNCLETHGAVIVGGETSSCPKGSPIVISVSATGEVLREQLVLRSGGKAGEVLLVSGKLGGSLAGKHLDFKPRVDEADWLTRHFKPGAMMDLSDGLAKDLPRLARASGCGFKLNRDAVPLTDGRSIEQALNDGEDYELLFTLQADLVAPLLEAWSEAFSRTELSVIGELCGIEQSDSIKGGWDHFPAG